MRIRLPIIESIAHRKLNKGLVSRNFDGIDYKKLADELAIIPKSMEEIDNLCRKYLSEWVDFDAEPMPPVMEMPGTDIMEPVQEEYFHVDIPILSNNEVRDDRKAFFLNACDIDLARTKHRLLNYSKKGVSVESYYREVDLTLWKIAGYCNWLNFMYGDIYTCYGCEKPAGGKDADEDDNLVLIKLLQKHMLRAYAELTVIFAPKSPVESMRFVMEKTGGLIQLGLSKLNVIRADIMNKAQTCIRLNDKEGMEYCLVDFKKYSDDSSLDYPNYSTVYIALVNNLYLGGNHNINELINPGYCDVMAHNIAKKLDKAGVEQEKAKLQAYADTKVFDKTIPGMVMSLL